MRADGWQNLPLIRMTNINLEPGEGTLEEIIGDTKDGMYMATNQSWSIDDKRVNFQFGSGSTTRAISRALPAAFRAPSFEKSFDAATPTRPPVTTRTRTPVSSRHVL